MVKPKPREDHRRYNLRDRQAMDEKNWLAEKHRREVEAEVEKKRKERAKERAKERKRKKKRAANAARRAKKGPDPEWLPPSEQRAIRTGTPVSEANHLEDVYPAYGMSLRVRPLQQPQRTPHHTWSDLKGVDEIKKRIFKSVVAPFSAPRKFGLLWDTSKIPRGILLFGLPGTGKTALADAIVSEIRQNGRPVNYYQGSGNCLSKYFGESEKNVAQLFKMARDNAPSIILLDELDGLGRKRGDDATSHAMNTVLTTLLDEMNKVPRGDVLIIAATNIIANVDPALIRAGRFDVKVEMGLPDAPAREEIVSYYFEKEEIVVEKIILESIVEATERFTGAQLEVVVNRILENVTDRIYPNSSWMHMPSKEILARRDELLQVLDEDVRPVLAQRVGLIA